MSDKGKTFLDEDFLLESPHARELYHRYAKDLPIIDYHNHLPPGQIADDRVFDNLAQVWLNGDHYKWRAMRAHGVDERASFPTIWSGWASWSRISAISTAR